MKILLLLAALAAGWWFYRRAHPSATPAAAVQAADNTATRYVGSLQNDEKKAADAVSKMNAGIGRTEKAVDEAAKQ